MKGIKLRNYSGEEKEYFLFEVTIMRGGGKGKFHYWLIGTDTETIRRDLIQFFNTPEEAMRIKEELEKKYEDLTEEKSRWRNYLESLE